MPNSNVPTLDASNLTYEFEQDARKYCFYDILQENDGGYLIEYYK